MRLFYLLFSSAIGLGCMLLLELFELRIEHGSGNDTGCNIRNRHAVPHAFYSPKRGRISRQGIRINTCRLRERMMAFLAMPILWKKLEVTI